ncbi:MAG: prepilin-type N-terminal cleavage/methylation domain-containing protein [Alphaproteobacteria bacterium]
MSTWTGSPAGSRSGTRGAPRNGRTRGFTLIEVVVAFAILALALGVLLHVFSTGLDNARVSEAYTMATLLAESKLAAVGIEEPLAEGETAGRFDDRFRWRVAVRPHGESPPDEDGSVRAYNVIVTVFWDKRDGERSVSLSTLRLAPRR